MRREQAYIYIYTRWYKGTKRRYLLRCVDAALSFPRYRPPKKREKERKKGRTGMGEGRRKWIFRVEKIWIKLGEGEGRVPSFIPCSATDFLFLQPPHQKKCKFSKWKLVERLGQCEPPPRCPPQHLRIPILFLEFNLFAVQGTLRFVHSRVKDTVMARIPANFDIFFHRDSIRLINQGPRESNSLRWTNLVVGKWFFTSF